MGAEVQWIHSVSNWGQAVLSLIQLSLWSIAACFILIRAKCNYRFGRPVEIIGAELYIFFCLASFLFTKNSGILFPLKRFLWHSVQQPCTQILVRFHVLFLFSFYQTGKLCKNGPKWMTNLQIEIPKKLELIHSYIFQCCKKLLEKGKRWSLFTSMAYVHFGCWEDIKTSGRLLRGLHVQLQRNFIS